MNSKPPSRILPFLFDKEEHIARLAIECFTELFQRDEVDSQCFTLFQAPQRRMANACLLRQPIKRPPAHFKQLIDANLNHRASFSYKVFTIYETYCLYVLYFIIDTYTRAACTPGSCQDSGAEMARGSLRYYAEALAAGGDDSIEKPFDIEKLRTGIGDFWWMRADGSGSRCLS